MTTGLSSDMLNAYISKGLLMNSYNLKTQKCNSQVLSRINLTSELIHELMLFIML